MWCSLVSKHLHSLLTSLEFSFNSIHIRRTDKVGTEAAFHKLSEYMDHAEEYFKTIEMVEPVQQKRIYIATDEPVSYTHLTLPTIYSV